MLSLKIMSTSLRSVSTGLTINQLGSTSIALSSASWRPLSCEPHQDNHLQQTSRSRFLSTNFVLGQKDTKVLSKYRRVTSEQLETGVSLPLKPKRPNIPWTVFVNERKADVLKQKHNMTASELAKILAKEWKVIDQSRYIDEYQQRREDYLKELEEYKNSLTDQQLEYLECKKSAARQKRTLRKLRKTKPPKLPRNAANLFCAGRCQDPAIKEQLKIRKPSEVFSELFSEYRSLSEHEKKKYNEMKEQDLERFQNEFNDWYNSIKSKDSDAPKAVREHADMMRAKYKLLNYI